MISIIVPIYNSAPYLEKCLSSLKEQTYSNIEIIMIDDGSTDNSSIICKKYESEDDRFIYIYQKNAGVSAARNLGISVAKGDYIGFCDSDDWVESDMYEILRNMIIRENADVSIISFQTNSSINFTPFEPKHYDTFTFSSKDAILEMHNGINFQGHLCNKLIKRELMNNMSLRADVSICEDMLFMWMVFLKSNKIAFCDIPKYHYIMLPQSATNRVLNDGYWRSLQISANEMAKYMATYYPECIHYAQKTIISNNIWIAEKAVLSKAFTKQIYMAVKKEIKVAYNSKSKKLFSLKQRIKISSLLLGRFSYLFLMNYIKRSRKTD